MENQVATTASSMPSYLDEYAKKNNSAESINISELKIPYLKRVEYLSVEFNAKKDNLGHIINSVTSEDYGAEMEIVILKQYTDWVRFGKDKKVDARSSNGKTWDWGVNTGVELTSDEKFKCKHYNFYVLVLRRNGETLTVDPIPHLLVMSNTSAKEGNKLYNIISMQCLAKNLPLFTYAFKLSTIVRKEGTNTFSVWRVEPVQGFMPENIFKKAEAAKEVVEERFKNIPAQIAETIPEESAEAAPIAVNPADKW